MTQVYFMLCMLIKFQVTNVFFTVQELILEFRTEIFKQYFIFT